VKPVRDEFPGEIQERAGLGLAAGQQNAIVEKRTKDQP